MQEICMIPHFHYLWTTDHELLMNYLSGGVITACDVGFKMTWLCLSVISSATVLYMT